MYNFCELGINQPKLDSKHSLLLTRIEFLKTTFYQIPPKFGKNWKDIKWQKGTGNNDG